MEPTDTGLPQIIARTMDNAIEHLRQSSEERQRVVDGLMMMGQLHEAYPAVLVVDRILGDSAKTQWLYLAQEARKQQPHGAIGMPRVEDVAAVLGQSRGTVIRDRILLRLTRWISLIQRVRDDRTGRYLGQVYALHTEPAQLADAVRYDKGYMALLEEHRDSSDRRLQAGAYWALSEMEARLEQGVDPLERQDDAKIRMETMSVLYALPGQEPEDAKVWGGSTLKQLQAALEDFRLPGTKSGPGEGPGTNFEPGYEPSPKFVPGQKSGQKTADSLDNSLETASILREEKDEKGNFDTSICSSSNNKTTTTVGEVLRWHEGFDDNTRRMVMHAIKSQRIASEHYQDLLDALSHAALNPNKPLISPVAYAIELCRRIKDGRFNPPGPPLTRKDEKARQQKTQVCDLRLRKTEAKGEIDTLQGLIKQERNQEARQTLTRQLEQAQHRLASLQGAGGGS